MGYTLWLEEWEMRRIFALSAPVLALLLAGETRAADSTDVKALKENEVQWNKDFAAKDLEKLAGHYAGDAVLMSPGEPAASGKEAIRGVLKCSPIRRSR